MDLYQIYYAVSEAHGYIEDALRRAEELSASVENNDERINALIVKLQALIHVAEPDAVCESIMLALQAECEANDEMEARADAMRY